MSPTDHGRGDVQSVHRALDLLEAIGHRGDAGVSELARGADLAASTVHNLLRTLARRGYLINVEGRYRLGPGISVLSSRFDPVLALPPLLLPAARTVSKQTGLATTATVLVGTTAQVLWHELGPGTVTVRAPEGEGTHPLTLATGRLLVAMTRQTDWHLFTASADTIEPGWSHAKWISYLAEVARTALCLKDAHDPQEPAAIAVPVWSGDGSVICSIGCAAPGTLTSLGRFEGALDALWTASTAISAQLGCVVVPFPKPTVRDEST